MEFSGSDLPEGLSLEGTTGQITGRIAAAGEHLVLLRATNRLGSAERTLRIKVGEEIALTPPMGWNSWNIWAGRVTQEKVAAAARALVASGLRDHGWSYINLDDGWQSTRGGAFNAIQPNSKFPDMPRLANEIHALGLKFGIYSSPWRTTFLGHIGSSGDHADGTTDWVRAGQHNEFFKYKFPRDEPAKFSWLKPLAHWRGERRRDQLKKELRTFGKFSFVKEDVAQWAQWGVDYLKYDWTPVDTAHSEEMRRELRGAGRDIVFSVANNAPFPIAPQLSGLANAWRTSVDVKDNWPSLQSAFKAGRWAPFNRPGHFNDPDMLVIGQLGWGKPRPTKLTSAEQYTHMSLWCLLSGPLLLGCDLEKLDPFTLGLITNDEVLEINQDPLCKQARRLAHAGDSEVYAKPLEDGSWAVGLCNRGRGAARVAIKWSSIGRSGAQQVRDLWRQKDLGIFQDGFEASVVPHGVLLVRIIPAR